MLYTVGDYWPHVLTAQDETNRGINRGIEMCIVYWTMKSQHAVYCRGLLASCTHSTG
jgi:hypothetical protein